MDETTDQCADAVCPICRARAEGGCVYGRDGGWIGLRWVAGEPSLTSNIATAIGGGEPVGEHELFRGPYARGIRCDRCQRIVLEM